MSFSWEAVQQHFLQARDTALSRGGRPSAKNKTRRSPPAGMLYTFTTSDGHRVWELGPNRYLVERDGGPGADKTYVPIVFDLHWLRSQPSATRRHERAGTSEGLEVVRIVRGLAIALGVSLPMWLVIIWVVWRLVAQV